MRDRGADALPRAVEEALLVVAVRREEAGDVARVERIEQLAGRAAGAERGDPRLTDDEIRIRHLWPPPLETRAEALRLPGIALHGAHRAVADLFAETALQGARLAAGNQHVHLAARKKGDGGHRGSIRDRPVAGKNRLCACVPGRDFPRASLRLARNARIARGGVGGGAGWALPRPPRGVLCLP